jgi:8-oxo-dGTP pyrophosphatase MutT (NUDIX family)
MFGMEKQFTASVYIIDGQKVLLIKHPKLKKWLPPGGHVEANETPVEAAYREVLEETGLEIELITQENVWVNCWNAKSFVRPYLCLLEEIPPYKNQPAHQHMDFVYLARLVKGKTALPSELPYEWFDKQDLDKLQPDVDIFHETLQILHHLLVEKSQPTLEHSHSMAEKF